MISAVRSSCHILPGCGRTGFGNIACMEGDCLLLLEPPPTGGEKTPRLMDVVVRALSYY